MKKAISLFCAAVLLVMMLSLTACGGSGTGVDVSGEYKLVEMKANGEDLSDYLSLIGDVTLSIDGTKATLNMGGEITELTVDTSKMVMSAGSDASPFTIDGNKLTLSEDDTSMVFEKQ